MTYIDLPASVDRDQYFACARKRQYCSRKQAKNMAKGYTRDSGTKLKVYQCQFCKLWHVTKKGAK